MTTKNRLPHFLGVALSLALGAGASRAEAASIIHFDDPLLSGGTVTSSGGFFYGNDIPFSLITLEDSVTNATIKAAQCGLTAADACLLDFNTETGTFTLTAPGGLYTTGADFVEYNDAGALISAGPDLLVLLGTIFDANGFVGIDGSGAVGLTGVDTKDPLLLAYFGVPNELLIFTETNIFFGSAGSVFESDLINTSTSGGTQQLPEPATLTLLGLGVAGGLAKYARRRRSAAATTH